MQLRHSNEPKKNITSAINSLVTKDLHKTYVTLHGLGSSAQHVKCSPWALT